MNRVSLLKKREAGPKPIDQEARAQDDARPECATISLRSFLEADNKRLWQAVLELSVETAALRRVLKTRESHSRRVAGTKPPDRRLPRSSVTALSTPEVEPHVLPFGR
jgi:hypothetical protein